MKIVSRITLLLICMAISCFTISAQTNYGNEWINPSKTYLKFKVAENGMYKVTFEELEKAGLISGNIDGTIFQLFNYGKEQAIHISDNDFGPGDHLEFYGTKNTIGLDSLLYDDWQKDLFNPEYSLVTDSNSYFLTLSPENSNKRFTLVEPNYENNTLAPYPYYLHEEKIVYSSVFFKNVETNKTQQSQFEASEGFGTGVQQISNINLNVSKYYMDGPVPLVKFRIGLNNQLSRLDISWNSQLIESKILLPKKTFEFEYPIDKNQINASNTLTLKNTNSLDDKHRMAFVNLIYPRAFDFGNNTEVIFKMPAAANKRFLEINAFKHENKEVYLYDTEKQLRYKTALKNDRILVILNASSSEAKYVLSTLTNKKVHNLSIFKPKIFKNEGQEYVIISKKVLYSPGLDFAREYAEYRNSPEGGSYKTEIIDIQDIYDHFGYGIDRHFYSIKKMAKYLKDFWVDNKYVLILGKSIEYPYIRTSNDILNYEDKVFFIPTFGFTGSDNLLFSEHNFPDPYFAVGRIAVRTPGDIKNYLDKVKLFDKATSFSQTIDGKYWTKKVLHLGGGKNENEQNGIQKGLKSMAQILEDTIYGAEIFSYFKKSSEAVDFNVNEDINDVFNSGLSLVNFFGHSSAGTWDFAIENPRNYNNYGRYPFINSFGCYSGNLHGLVKGISESFVLEKDKGAIAFFASTGTAFIGSLSNYGTRFYDNLVNKRRGESFGQIIQNLAFTNRTSKGDELSLYTQLTYHGDPALKPYLYSRPDYIFDNTITKTLPSIILASEQNFQISLNIKNLGSALKDSVDVLFVHYLPSGKINDSIWVKTGAIYNQWDITVPLKNAGILSIGKNNLKGYIDPYNKIIELPSGEAENNNELNLGIGFDFFVTDNYASAIYPPEYAMINTKDHYVLKASTSSVPVTKGNYIFQIDTTAYFNSLVMETGKVATEGGLILYEPKLPLVADRVYYWRVSPDSLAGQGYKWSKSSFAYVPTEEEGWNQSHFFQFTANEFTDMSISEETGRKFEFGKTYHNVRLRNKLWDLADVPAYIFSNKQLTLKPWSYIDAGIGMVVNNQFNMWDLLNPAGGLFGSYNPTGRAIDDFSFKTDTPEDRKKAMDFIEDKIKSGYYLTFFTIQNNLLSDYKPEEWAADSLLYGKSLFTVLEKLGAKKIRELATIGSVPYALQLVNGKEGVLDEEIAAKIDDIVEVSSIYYSKLFSGKTSSVEIGPVKEYGNVNYQISGLNHPEEKSQINLYGIENSGVVTKIDSSLKNKTPINANPDLYNKIKLENVIFDSLDRTAPQIDFWRVSYKPLPDIAISFVKSEPSPTNNELNQGEKIRIHYNVANVNYVQMDSILVKYTFAGSNNQSITTFKKIKPLGVGESIDDVAEFSVGTDNLSEVRIIIEINPNQNQPELNTFNNVLTKQFGVAKDADNPLLDIYFDGVSIMDGDIVSPKPEILITLADDNAFLPVTDAELFEIKLDTGRNQLLEIPMSSPQIIFTPASLNNKTAKVMYHPALKEGEYRLIVQGKDVAGNKSGINPKSISFRVIEKQSISNVMNYPNPFSNSTQFVFTLTGEQIPEIMSISIMTISGKVVKEITKEELGPLHIGINKTEYKWDGTDDYGSKLANGVYLYKVNIRKSNGDQYDHFSNSKADIFFKEGFGKMVIIR